MRRSPAAWLLAGVAALTSACVDLFHSTSFETLCDVHPDACAGEGGVEAGGPTDFCAASSATARDRATHACAWLGACTVPFDQSAFGACMVDAIQAYDCAANPNRTIAPGALHDLWDALWQATTCAEVEAAVNPSPVTCSGTGFACAGAPAPSVLFECVGSVGGAESCLVEGRVCAQNSLCAPAGAAASCSASSCEGTVWHDCESSVDVGYDCQYFGAGTCSGSASAAACAPSFTHGGGARCDASDDVTCDGATATACVSGGSVSIDCALLGGSCKSGKASPVWNLAGQCQGSGGCTPGCDGDTLTGCAQGLTFTTSCSGAGLGACRTVALVESMTGYACAAPAK